MTLEERHLDFIRKGNLKHDNKYDYSLVEYINSKTKVSIICSEHGVFEQRPNEHMKYGCYQCGINKRANSRLITIDDFVSRSNNIHGDYYDYSLVEYRGHKHKVKIVCSIHGMFEQRANDHLSGQGCPKCKESKGERKIRIWLENNKISYIPQHSFDECRSIRPLPFDFYLPDYNLCIEYDGEQHYRQQEGSLFGGSDEFNKRLKHDKIKNEFCNKSQNPSLLRIKYDKYNEIDSILFKQIN